MVDEGSVKERNMERLPSEGNDIAEAGEKNAEELTDELINLFDKHKSCRKETYYEKELSKKSLRTKPTDSISKA